MVNSKLFLLTLIAMISGCASIQHTEKVSDVSLYQFYIDSTGALLDPNSENTVDNEELYVQKVIDNFKKRKADNSELKITVFIHGGLNSFENATERVRKIKDKMLSDNRYPVFISWRSGGVANYFDHLFSLRRGEKKGWFIGGLTSPFVLAEDGLRSLARVPASTYNVIFGQNSVRKGKFDKEEQAAALALRQLEKQGFMVHNDGDDTGFGFKDIWSIWNPIKLISAPFVDGLGTGAWNSMLRRTDLVIRKNKGFDGGNEEESNTAVTKFFNKITKELDGEELIIIGHSMGAIIANNIISKFNDVKFSEIVYMAAACSIKDIEIVIPQYLKANKDTRFFNLSLNPYNDIMENTFLDFAPRGSLLMWIDDTLGTTNSFQDKTAGFWFNIIRGASEAFKDPTIRRRVHLTQFGIDDDGPQM